jgi:hypothetical protein
MSDDKRILLISEGDVDINNPVRTFLAEIYGDQADDGCLIRVTGPAEFERHSKMMNDLVSVDTAFWDFQPTDEQRAEAKRIYRFKEDIILDLVR